MIVDLAIREQVDLLALSGDVIDAGGAGAGFAVSSLLGTTEGTFVSASIAGEPVAAGAVFPRNTAVDLVFL